MATWTKQSEQLSARLLEFALRVLRMVKALPRTVEARHVAKQILRSGTSAGANYAEACGAESRVDFAHKLNVTLKELKETRYWLHLARQAPLVKSPARLDALVEESEQLIRIIAKSVATLRSVSKK